MLFKQCSISKVMDGTEDDILFYLNIGPTTKMSDSFLNKSESSEDFWRS